MMDVRGGTTDLREGMDGRDCSWREMRAVISAKTRPRCMYIGTQASVMMPNEPRDICGVIMAILHTVDEREYDGRDGTEVGAGR